ncbi:MAG: Trimethylamine corrinoid protein [Candidatus Thorarchaeota archaeon AB_25]|nr:MAG: Trimethylamine corrinoid protein [Candidatus Thorarchaeota archaeon AB_25]
MTSSILESLKTAVSEGDSEKSVEFAKKALESDIPPLDAITNGLAKGVKEVGDLFSEGEAFLVELVMAGDAMKAGMSVLLPVIKESKAEMISAGKVMIGTVQGDIHSIGKDIVGTLLEADGFEVLNVGEDVQSEAFVEKVKEHKPDVLGLSSLLTATLPAQKAVIEQLKVAGLRGDVKVIIGGAPTTQEWADEIGADGWAGDAVSAVSLVKQLVKG